ncbi:hypothetical protein [Nocardiopsis synnemataformans]|uniref:hypothetical protein n=1 Tax=Nocardiopsis synnemataformans TaxID=61305 RepID=UPI003EBCAA3F
MDLEAIEARANAATEGPLRIEVQEFGRVVLSPAGRVVASVSLASDAQEKADAEFFTAARTDVPDLVARVRALEDENQRMRDEIAARIVEEERSVQEQIVEEPLNTWLAGLLFGLQRGRDIVTSPAREIAEEEA